MLKRLQKRKFGFLKQVSVTKILSKIQEDKVFRTAMLSQYYRNGIKGEKGSSTEILKKQQIYDQMNTLEDVELKKIAEANHAEQIITILGTFHNHLRRHKLFSKPRSDSPYSTNPEDYFFSKKTESFYLESIFDRSPELKTEICSDLGFMLRVENKKETRGKEGASEGRKASEQDDEDNEKTVRLYLKDDPVMTPGSIIGFFSGVVRSAKTPGEAWSEKGGHTSTKNRFGEDLLDSPSLPLSKDDSLNGELGGLKMRPLPLNGGQELIQNKLLPFPNPTSSSIHEFRNRVAAHSRNKNSLKFQRFQFEYGFFEAEKFNFLAVGKTRKQANSTLFS